MTERESHQNQDSELTFGRIASELEERRTDLYDGVDTVLADVRPGTAAFLAFTDWVNFYKIRGEFEQADAQIAKRETLGLPDVPDLESRSEGHYARLQELHALHEKNQTQPGYLESIAVFEAQLLGPLLGVEEAVLKVRHVDTKKPTTWRSVGLVSEEDIRANPEEPTHFEIQARAMTNMAHRLETNKQRLVDREHLGQAGRGKRLSADDMYLELERRLGELPATRTGATALADVAKGYEAKSKFSARTGELLRHGFHDADLLEGASRSRKQMDRYAEPRTYLDEAATRDYARVREVFSEVKSLGLERAEATIARTRVPREAYGKRQGLIRRHDVVAEASASISSRLGEVHKGYISRVRSR